MRVSPAFLTIEIQKGNIKVFDLLVLESDFEYNLSSNKFEIKSNESLEIAKNFVTLHKKDNSTLQLTISPTEEISSGSYETYLIINKILQKTSEISVKETVSVPILINVYAKDDVLTNDTLHLKNYAFKQNLLSESKLLEVTFENDSNFYFVPRGVLELHKAFGIGPDKMNIPVNKTGKVILGKSQRQFDVDYQVNKEFLFGIYSPELYVVTGKDNTVSKYSMDNVLQIYIPHFYLVIIILIVLMFTIKIIYKLKK